MARHSELGDEKEFADPVGSGFDVGCKKEKSKLFLARTIGKMKF